MWDWVKLVQAAPPPGTEVGEKGGNYLIDFRIPTIPMFHHVLFIPC